MIGVAGPIVAWDAPLTGEEREALLARVAGEVVRRGLEVPVLLLLEIHRPAGFLLSQGLIVFGPLLGGLVGAEWASLAARFLQEPGTIDTLIRRIEEEAERG